MTDSRKTLMSRFRFEVDEKLRDKEKEKSETVCFEEAVERAVFPIGLFTLLSPSKCTLSKYAVGNPEGPS